MSLNIEFNDIGLTEYKQAWGIQEEKHIHVLSVKKSGNDFAGHLIFCEHPHVYTLGKSGRVNNLLINNDFLKNIGATYYKSNRGGDITYHGPGQLVGYPIFNLELMKTGVKDYVHLLEEAIIKSLNYYSIKASRYKGATGVWLDTGTKNARKICAIGVRVSRAVTMHGFALNVNTDLNYFSHINPCGFVDKGVTSIQKETGQKINFDEVKVNLKNEICRVFGLTLSN